MIFSVAVTGLQILGLIGRYIGQLTGYIDSARARFSNTGHSGNAIVAANNYYRVTSRLNAQCAFQLAC